MVFQGDTNMCITHGSLKYSSVFSQISDASCVLLFADPDGIRFTQKCLHTDQQESEEEMYFVPSKAKVVTAIANNLCAYLMCAQNVPDGNSRLTI